jgi:uncharacterized RDD family membrane protein YckC
MNPSSIATASSPQAGIARRLGAVLYEALLLVALVFVASFVALPLITPGHAGPAATLAMPDLAHRVILFCLLFGVVAGYFVWSWKGGHRTLPMKTWRLRLVLADGAPVPARTALLRFLCACIGPAVAVLAYGALRPYGLGAHAIWLVALNFLWAFVDPERQFLHDRLAGTRIVTALPVSRTAATSA